MPPRKSQTASATQQNATQQNQTQQPATQDAVSLLKADHRKVEGLFAQYEKTESTEEKSKLAKQICKELIVHTKLEEEIFYPACREKNVEDDMLDEAQVEHDGAKVMIAELIAETPDDAFYDAKVTVLSEYIKHHVGEEEKPRDGIFAKAQKAGVDMNALGQKLQARKQELTGQTDENNLQPPKPRSLDPQNLEGQETTGMARYSNDRDRDERGRFTSDDDDRRGGYSSSSRGGYSSRSRDDDDDDRRGGNRGGNHERDDQGRFTSDDDGRGRSSSRGGYSSRSRDDDDGRGRGRGWYGDSEGHSEASERGWEGRSSSRGGYSSRSRDDDDDDRRGRSGGGRGQGGWFGDSEGHSEAAERGWEGRSSSRGGSSSRSRDDDDDRGGRSGGGRGHGGWFGDSEGHSEAAERGWEGRSSSRGGGSSSRSRDYDDDDDRRGSRGGRSEGHGGWFGDPRGHSEAARRGWRDRD